MTKTERQMQSRLMAYERAVANIIPWLEKIPTGDRNPVLNRAIAELTRLDSEKSTYR